MSIKTLRKRISLVAVVSLGFGLVPLAPANAVVASTVSVYTQSPSTSSGNRQAATVGTAVTVAGNVTTTGALETAYLVYTAGVAIAPAGSNLAVVAPVSASANATTGKAAFLTAAGNATVNEDWTLSTVNTVDRKDLSGTDGANLAAEKRFTLAVNPDLPGDYAINVTIKPYDSAGDTSEDDWRTLTFYINATTST